MTDTFESKLEEGIKNKPNHLIISDLKWKYLIRCVLRGENILLVGPTGCGKTMASSSVAKVLNRPFFKFNVGSTQDARATLIGNTIFDKSVGTIFHASQFVKAISTPNSIILLDELTRGSHDCWNILMPPLDPSQRDLRIDEDSNSSIVKVAEGVCFISTANIGSEYTATRILDKAISDRFPIKIEMEALNETQLNELFSIVFPIRSKSEIAIMQDLASISEDIRVECKKEDSNISTPLSSRSIVKMAELVMDKFILPEIAEVAIYPEYPDDSGMDSERIFVKTILQSYFPSDAKNPIRDPRKPVKLSDE
jgi:MoxR-like ATPase